MNILGINPTIIFKEFISNDKIRTQVELSEKISTLSEEKIDFLNSITDLLKDFN